jgi:hypothetical protein
MAPMISFGSLSKSIVVFDLLLHERHGKNRMSDMFTTSLLARKLSLSEHGINVFNCLQKTNRRHTVMFVGAN